MLVLVSFFVVELHATTVPISIYCPNFGSDYIDNWTLNGSSVVVNNNLRLTNDRSSEQGTAFWTNKVCNSDSLSFSAFFIFRIGKSTYSADGLTFIIQQYSDSYGELDGGMGYGGIPGKSIAIEFDTYQNLLGADPDNGHIAVDIDGIVDHDDVASYMDLSKSSILVTKSDLNDIGIDIVDEDLKYVWVDYNGTNLQVRISNSSTRPVDPIIDIEYDLVAYFDGQSTFFGFGAATRSSFYEKHFIKSVYIHNSYDPIDVENLTYEQGDFSTASETYASICAGENYSFNGVDFYTDTIVTFNLDNAEGCDSMATLVLDVQPSQTTWTGAYDSDWFNDDNWDTKHPNACSNVIIPDLANGVQYPIITSAAACKNITFEPGGAVLGLQYLTYEKVHVELELQRNKWYTLTSPLKSQFSGDYCFSGAPRSYMMLFDDVNPDNASDVAVGTWTKSFSDMLVSLTPGMGFGFFVDSIEFDYPNPVIVNTDDKTVSFPREDSLGVLQNTVIPYNGITGKLYPSITKTISRDSSAAYRFAMEDSDGVLGDVDVDINPGLNLIGNPLMSHLDFDELYESNEDMISDKVKFWNGTTFVTYMAGSEISSDMNLDYTKVPPMQAFFVEGCDENPQLHMNISKHFVADTTAKLRSQRELPDQLLQVKASKNQLESSTVIAKRILSENGYDDKDAFKLFTQYKQVPEVYTIADCHSLDINQFSKLPYVVPLGVKSSSIGFISLEFLGAQSFEGIDVTLLNTLTGEQQNLKTNNMYKLYNDGAIQDGSLFIEFRKASTVTQIDENNSCADKSVSIYAEDGTVHVACSSEDKIKHITLWEERGRQLCNVNGLDTNNYQVKVNVQSHHICIARVQTNNSTYITKVIVQ